MDRKEFIEIWEAWDNQPGAFWTADALVKADTEVGERLGMSHTALREALAQAKPGRTYEEAVEFVVNQARGEDGPRSASKPDESQFDPGRGLNATGVE